MLELLDAPMDEGFVRIPMRPWSCRTAGFVRNRELVPAIRSPASRVSRPISMPDAQVPPALRGLIDRESTDHPEHNTLSGFVRALSYFERPNRRADVAAFYRRVKERFVRVEADQELERLRAKVAEEAAAAERRQPPEWLRVPIQALRASGIRPMTAVLWLLIVLNGVGLLWIVISPGPERAGLRPISSRSLVSFAPLPASPLAQRRATPPPQATVSLAGTAATMPVPQSTAGRNAPVTSAPALSRAITPPVPPVEWTVAIREVVPPLTQPAPRPRQSQQSPAAPCRHRFSRRATST